MTFYANQWEMFYTEAKSGDDNLVDQISINNRNKRYLLEIETNYMATDGYDEVLVPISSKYVSRFLFEMIVEGVKNKGYKELDLNEDGIDSCDDIKQIELLLENGETFSVAVKDVFTFDIVFQGSLSYNESDNKNVREIKSGVLVIAKHAKKSDNLFKRLIKNADVQSINILYKKNKQETLIVPYEKDEDEKCLASSAGLNSEGDLCIFFGEDSQFAADILS